MTDLVDVEKVVIRPLEKSELPALEWDGAYTKFRRVYEAAIFKTLGATRRLIAAVLVLEYGLLGLLAGGIGAAGAIGLTWAISRYALDIPFRPLYGVSAIGVVATAVLVASIGVIAPDPGRIWSRRITPMFRPALTAWARATWLRSSCATSWARTPSSCRSFARWSRPRVT